MDKLYTLKEASKLLNVTKQTIRNWDNEGKMRVVRTEGRHRRIPESEIKRILGESKQKTEKTCVIYARVSTRKQVESGNLDRQKERLALYAENFSYKVIDTFSEIASGINEKRRQLFKMLNTIKDREIDYLLIEYKDRLARFGYKYLKKYVNDFGCKIVVTEKEEEIDSQKELVDDLIAIVTSFSARIYGARGAKVAGSVKKILIEELDNAVSEDNDNCRNL